jgi:RNA polymerase sigma-70 factor (ECF subfamily)
MKTNLDLISEQLPYFRAIAYRSLPKRYLHLADDLAQDAIIKAIENIKKYDPSKGNFKSWLYRVTQNLCFDAIRRMDKMDLVPLNGTIYHHDTTELRDLEHMQLRAIRKAMAFLSKRDRQLITYRFMYGMSGREMSQLMNIPESQINIYFQRAKNRLKELCKEAA